MKFLMGKVLVCKVFYSQGSYSNFVGCTFVSGRKCDPKGHLNI